MNAVQVGSDGRCNVTGVDYFTCSTSDHRSLGAITEVMLPHFMEEERTGRGVLKWGIQGYRGKKTNHAFIGARDDGVLCQVSGALADQYFSPLMTYAENVSRLDVHVTFPVADVKNDISRVRDEAEAGAGRRGKPTSVKYIGARQGLQTVYIGRPASDQMGRVYDKWEESKDEAYKGTVRYEVQLRRKAALATALHLKESYPVRTSACVNFVQGWYRARGVQVADLEEREWTTPVPKREKTKVERQIDWIAAQVSPVFCQLLAEGYGEEVLKALIDKSQDATYTCDVIRSLLVTTGE